MATRPDPVDCDDFDSPAGVPHGAPLTHRGVLQAASRDASWYERPDVHSAKASHVIVASHVLGIGSGSIGPAAACDPVRIIVDTSLVRTAADVHPNGRCARPGCRELFARAVADAAAAELEEAS